MYFTNYSAFFFWPNYHTLQYTIIFLPIGMRYCTYQVNKLCHRYLPNVGMEVDQRLEGGAKARGKVVARHSDKEVLALLQVED